MKRMRDDILLRIVKTINVLMIAIPVIVKWFTYYIKQTKLLNEQQIESWLFIILFCLIYALFGKVYDAFMVSLSRISEMIYSQALAAIISDGILFIILWMLIGKFPKITPMIGIFIGQVFLSLAWSIIVHKWYFWKFPPQKTLIVYDTRVGMKKLISDYGFEKKFDVQDTVYVKECLENLSMLCEVNTVFLSGIHSHDRNVLLKYCVEHGILVYVIPRVGDVLMSGAKQMHMLHLPILRVGRYHPSPIFAGVKRLFDICASGIAIILLSPIIIITAVIIKMTDGGAVFYKQVRLTKNGREFEVLKFRSMKEDAEKDGVARLSSGENDDRITPIGRFIRKVRIDELPQLFNILKGDMTIVGPRPERPEIAAEYEKEMPEFRLRLQAKAGLTGYAQVYGKYNTTPYDKLQMDLMYIANPNLVEDLRIIFATIKILFVPESTEGVEEGQITAIGNEKKESKVVAASVVFNTNKDKI